MALGVDVLFDSGRRQRGAKPSGEIALPDRTLNLAHQEAINAFDHSGGEVAVPRQGMRLRQGLDWLTEGRDARRTEKPRQYCGT